MDSELQGSARAQRTTRRRIRPGAGARQAAISFSAVLPRVVTHGEIPGAQREFVDPNVGDELGQQPPRLVEAGEVCDERCIWAGDKSSQRPQERSGPLPAARGHDSAGMQMLDDPGERSSGYSTS